jgi:hypothetical protein
MRSVSTIFMRIQPDRRWATISLGCQPSVGLDAQKDDDSSRMLQRSRSLGCPPPIGLDAHKDRGKVTAAQIGSWKVKGCCNLVLA